MQVISGKYRGYAITTLPGLATRPMIARMKEDAFNILSNYFIYENKVALDLFAGSGQLGLEALSRNVAFCYFNDAGKEANQVIKANLGKLKITDCCVLQEDYLQALRSLMMQNVKLDLLLLDPPFAQIEYYEKSIRYCLDNAMFNNYCIIVCETREPFDWSTYPLKVLKAKSYKNKYLYLLRKEEA